MTYHVDQCRDDEHDSDTQGSALHGILDHTKGANDDQTEEHQEQSDHVDGGSAHSGKEVPADDTSDKVTTGQGDVDVEGVDFAEPGFSKAVESQLDEL